MRLSIKILQTASFEHIYVFLSSNYVTVVLQFFKLNEVNFLKDVERLNSMHYFSRHLRDKGTTELQMLWVSAVNNA